ncbi:MAG: FKBP-type peptidyl-prolyl cis-trans isomerase [Rhodanobacter sp.]|nr:MAG: FKBP-type peptidyl-prolyl cis-trans isomerase [Rhodanobacter sp.]TAM07296.1 MAG: FKBP-type peptidyl-prolyl cis-trans isomerase [Rhodanobacter sp.]TAM42987.1 MAG: FKBP-type peptidyl-prolyl cis-trans isomerase [Rhodanobacter sp.]TAN28143.1 MAG: FKBP-type peptidyl-prolyl cis-trans isomerase [Rhodanobacter sp.]
MATGATYLGGFLLAGMLLGGALHAQRHAAAPAPAAAKPDKVKLSYAIGYQIGSRFAEGSPDVDLPTLQKAIADAYGKRKPTVPIQEMQAQLHRLQQQMHGEALAAFNSIAAANARKSAAFMAQNRKKPGVVQLPSGIQYSVLSKGAGTVHPSVTSTVVVNYRGMLADGTEFDSTWAHGAPVSFAVDKVIPGWRDVIPRMHVGDRWKVVIPPRLAYGEEGALPRIGPNEVLQFEIELLAIKPEHEQP